VDMLNTLDSEIEKTKGEIEQLLSIWCSPVYKVPQYDSIHRRRLECAAGKETQRPHHQLRLQSFVKALLLPCQLSLMTVTDGIAQV
jgi:hypothetical protein